MLNTYTFSQNIEGLQGETLLHPLDTFTAYTLKKGELVYNQALVPWPTWGWWGITDRITAEIDFEAWLGGVPSFNFRFAIREQTKTRPALAYETMFQHLAKEINLLEGYDNLRTLRKGASWYHRLNASWQVKPQLYLHLSAGVTYSASLVIENADRSEYAGRQWQDLVSPDFSAAIDWRKNSRLSFHSTVSYGTTFMYLDNVPRKYQFTYGFRIAPFLYKKRGILRNLRIELASITFYFPEAKEFITIPVPVFPVFYWQWGG